MAQRLADVLEVTLDYLVGDNELNTLQDKAMLNRWQSLEALTSGGIQSGNLYVTDDSLMRYAKTR